MHANILVIDDEKIIRDSCQQALARDGHRVQTASDGTQGLTALEKESFDLIVLDLKMPGLNGMEVLTTIHEKDPEIIVVVITGYATIESAVEAIKKGAYDFIPKPFTPEGLRTIVNRGLEKRGLSLENILLRTEWEGRLDQGVMIGESQAMQEIGEMILKIAPTDSTVLISGETGTGKELVARAIHKHSPRRDRPFIVVDCGVLVETLFESELFGHVKGAFTGADQIKYGRFEAANGGTLFLDEIGNINTSMQANLLRVLQEKEFTRVGSSQVIKVDVRIIAATNKDLLQCVKEGLFREDLFYRLSVVPIHLPPLHARKADIPLLVNYLLAKSARKRDKTVTGLSEQAMEILTSYDWPGNVRELENVIERAVILTRSHVIGPEDLWYYELHGQKQPLSNPGLHHTLADVEREHIINIYELMQGQIGKASEALGIDRKTLRTKLHKYGYPLP
jgi:DNA-binding NtrC family response regulator